MGKRIITVTLNPAFDVTYTLSELSVAKVNRVQSESREAAGTGINVAADLRALGEDAVAAGIAGSENLAPFLAQLGSRGIPARFVSTSGAIRTNTTLLCDGQTIKINTAGPGAGEKEIESLFELIRLLGREGDIAVFGGSLPVGVTSDMLCSLISRVSQLGMLIALDTDVLSAAQICALRPWVIKPNAYELSLILAREMTTEAELLDGCRELIAQGVGCVLLSNGERGVYLVTQDETLHARLPRVDEINSVGAGDASLAGFIAMSVRGKSNDECAACAAACGAAVVASQYCVISSAEEAERFMQDIIITRI